MGVNLIFSVRTFPKIMLGFQKMPFVLQGGPEEAAAQPISHLRSKPGFEGLFPQPDPVQTSILTGELVEASRAATARVEVSYTVPGVGEIVQTNRALDGSALSGADRKAEGRS